jgi:hypothetical protein
MGDSHIDTYNASDNSLPCLFQVRNSMLVQDIRNPSNLLTVLDQSQSGVNRTPVKLKNDDETYFWPGHGFAKQDTAIVFWQQYSGADLTHVQNYVARIHTPSLTDASAIKKFSSLSLPAEFEFGTAVVVDSTSQFVYLYGFKKDWIIFRPYIARFPFTQDVLQPWEFFDGEGWTSDVNSVQQIMGTTDDYVSPSFSVLKLQDKYYMISQDVGFLTCGMGRNIYSWESENPEGPFTNKKLLYTVEDKYNGEYMITYNATAHPEFIRNNELLVSYNVNGACTNYCQNPFASRFDADLYRPKFFRVALDYIDPTLNIPDPVFPGDPVTGIDDELRSNNVFVYPNPSHSGVLTINIENNHLQGRKAELRIINALGQPVVEDKFSGNEKVVQVPGKGIFLLEIKCALQTHIKRIVVQ